MATVAHAAPALLEHLGGKPPGELLCIAARRGFVPLARLLLHIGCGADSPGSTGASPLLHAVLGGHTDVVAALLQAGAAVNPAAEPEAGQQRGEEGNGSSSGGSSGGGSGSRRRSGEGRSRTSHPPPLIAAAKAGHAAIVRLLLQAGAELSAVDSAGCSALWHAADRTHCEVVRLLLERGPPELVDRPNQDGCTP